MNRLSHLVPWLAALLLAASCSKADFEMAQGDTIYEDGKAYTAIVTIKKSPSDTVYLQLNDSVTVYPTNWQDGYTRMERVICQAEVREQPTGSFPYTCYIHWLEPLDKGTVTADASVAGSDGVDIEEDWMTGVEDGYLTLHYTAWWGLNPVQHSFYLVTGTNPADPYEVELRHNANGDMKDQSGDSLVCFDINSLPDTGGSYKTMTLKWTTRGGSASEKTFRFKTRQ